MKNLILTLVILLSAGSSFAQDGAEEKGDKKEKIEAMKIAFITKELNLTSEEAQKFWPVYNEREAELEDVRKQMREIYKGKKVDEMTDTEVEKAIETTMALKQKELDIEKKYNAKFKTVIPIKKVAKLYVAEHKFKTEVMRQWRENHQQSGGGKPNGPGNRGGR